jgi:hypothetical protein
MFKEQANGQLYYKGQEVTLLPCFPSMDKLSCISVLDEEQNEVFFIDKTVELENDQQEMVMKHLYIEQLGHKITRVLDVREEIELRKYIVETNSGSTIFYTRSEDWPRLVKKNHFQFLDIHGDIFYIDEFSNLDKKSQKIISSFID